LERTLKNEEKLEDLRAKISTLNCSSDNSGYIITPVIDVQNDEDNDRVLSLESAVTGRVKNMEGEIRRLNSKLDSRLNSQNEFEGKLPKYIFVFSLIVMNLDLKLCLHFSCSLVSFLTFLEVFRIF